MADTSGADVAPASEAAEGSQWKPKNPKWLPLESNPKILNAFFQRVGVLGDFAFTDVLGLDDESLCLMPQPVVAVCLLFPSKAVRQPRLQALAGQESARKAPPSTFYLIQHKEFGNACGTIAAVHAIGNLAREGYVQLSPGSPIEAFLAGAAGVTPDALGRELANATALHEASEQAAQSRDAQTRTPDRDDKVDGHFVVFVQVQGRLVELDGCMGFPIDHGETSPGAFLGATARLIREEFMARAPGNPNFSVMALAPAVDQSALNASSVETLMAMGFNEVQAREALQAAGGNVDVAVGILCG